MTMRRILQCVLVLCALVMTGCGLFDSSNSSTNSANKNTNIQPKGNTNAVATTQQPLAPPNWKTASEKLQRVLTKISSGRQPAHKANTVSDELQDVLGELGDDDQEVSDKCHGCDESAIVAAQEARNTMADVVAILKPLKDNPLTAENKNKVKPLLQDASQKLQTAISTATPLEQSRPLTTPSSEPTAPPTKNGDTTTGYTTSDWINLALAILGGLLILVLIGTGFLHLRNQSRQHLEHHLAKAAAAHASVTREAQKEILDKLSSLSSAQTDTSTRLHDVHTEIRTLARLVRESSPSRGDGRSYTSLASTFAQNDPSPPKEEPDFPVFAGDYLGKMTRFSNVVKPDFQNGILINDPEGKGELMLIKDSRVPDETQPLFVVPRYAQFQTKQDFYTYYEKYYECIRPGAGDVWIIDPAVVEKVSGGWLLREKGVLEIR